MKVLKFEDFLFETKRQGNKKVLFISLPLREDDIKEVNYHNYISSKIKADFCNWEDLIFNENEILLNGNPISDYGFVFIGVVGDNSDYFVSVEEYLDLNKIPYFKHGCSPERNNKILQNRILTSENLNPIPTIIGICSGVDPKRLIKELGIPLVAKITNGSKGKGVTIQKTESDLKSYLKKNKDQKIIFQKFVENEGDYRLFFVDGKLIFSVERKSSDREKEFRNNYSLGGTAKKANLTKKEIDLARKAAKAMKFDVAGVDLIKEIDSNRWYILEINSAPQFLFPDIVDYREVLDEFIKIIKNKMP